MLIEWIAHYPRRDDTCSLLAHERLYATYPGTKTMYTDNVFGG